MSKKRNKNKTKYINKKTSTKVKKQDKSTKQKTIKPTAFEKFIDKYGLWVFIGLFFIIGIIAFKDFLTVKFVYFFKDIGSDSLNTMYPSSYLAQKLKAESDLVTWSFQIGMGQAYFGGVHLFTNPLTWLGAVIKSINILIWGENYFIFGRFLGLFINGFLVTGLIFYAYLRTLKLEKYSAVIGGLLVGFLGYSVLASSWGHTGIVRAAVIYLFATEQLLAKKRWYFFPIAVMFISENPFYMYLDTLFIIVYIVFRYFYFSDLKLKDYLISAGKMLVLGILGILMNGVNLITRYLKIFNSPRVGGDAGYSETLSNSGLFGSLVPEIPDMLSQHLTILYRFFSNDILGNGSNFKGWNNYLEAPIFYAGLITLLLVPQLFHFINKKQKIALGSYIGFWALIVSIPFLRHAFYAFTGDYFKAGLDIFVPVSLVFIAITALNKIYRQRKIYTKTLWITLAVLLAALFFGDAGTDKSYVVSWVRAMVVFFLIIYTFALSGIKSPAYSSVSVTALLVFICIELTIFSYYTVNEREAFRRSEFEQAAGGYFDNSIDAVNFLKERDSSFYRIEKDYITKGSQHGSLNDAKVQGFYGTSSYSSFNQGNYIKFLQEVEIIKPGDETATRWAAGLKGQPILDKWGNIKYYLTKDTNSRFLNLGYEKIGQTEDVIILKNNYYLPMGYTYGSYMTLEKFRQLSSFAKNMALLNAVIVDEELEPKLSEFLPEREITDSLINIDEPTFGSSFMRFSRNDFKDSIAAGENKSFLGIYRDNLMEDTLEINSHGQNFIYGKIQLDEPKLLFLTIPYDIGWKAIVNGSDYPILKTNIGFTGLMLKAGKYDIKLDYRPPYYKPAYWATIISNVLFAVLAVLAIFIEIRNRRKTKLQQEIN